MKASILALIMLGVLAAVIAIIVIAVGANKPRQSSSSPDQRLGSLVQPSPRRSASGYT